MQTHVLLKDFWHLLRSAVITLAHDHEDLDASEEMWIAIFGACSLSRFCPRAVYVDLLLTRFLGNGRLCITDDPHYNIDGKLLSRSVKLRDSYIRA